MKTIVLSRAAEKGLSALPGEVAAGIADALHLYAMAGRGDVKALTGRPGFRLRVGRYRVLFLEDAITVTVLHIGKRETTTYH